MVARAGPSAPGGFREGAGWGHPGSGATLDIHELPSARGCTYVLPAQDFALGLTLAAGPPEAKIRAAAQHLGVTAGEVDELWEYDVESAETVWQAFGRPVARCAPKSTGSRHLSVTSWAMRGDSAWIRPRAGLRGSPNSAPDGDA
ncbi:hypothetical protein ACFV98_04540 [Streptomyces violascens]|uniref:hypothetical protein n=1 Tax=Streptomyces violascens TaxID=67381 RepID=UPI0036569291